MRCTAVGTGKKYAVKIMDISHDASHEIDALVECQGQENIVELIEHLKDEKFVYIVFELLDGVELFSRIRDSSHFTEPTAQKYFKQLVNAVKFIHEKQFVHRDLKPENIMFVDKENSKLKIVDFGFARKKTSEESPACFTLDYAAPESLTTGASRESRDMWSLGVILYTMCMGHTPFMPDNVNKQRDEKKYRLQLKENIMKGAFNQSSAQYEQVSKSAKDLIANLLKVNESERSNVQQVLNHLWMRQAFFENQNMTETEKIHENGNKQQLVVLALDEPITIDDDSNEATEVSAMIEKQINEEVSSNDSSGINSLSDRNEGSSLSSHVDDLEEIQKRLTFAQAQNRRQPLSSPARSLKHEEKKETDLDLLPNGETLEEDSTNQPEPEEVSQVSSVELPSTGREPSIDFEDPFIGFTLDEVQPLILREEPAAIVDAPSPQSLTVFRPKCEAAPKPLIVVSQLAANGEPKRKRGRPKKVQTYHEEAEVVPKAENPKRRAIKRKIEVIDSNQSVLSVQKLGKKPKAEVSKGKSAIIINPPASRYPHRSRLPAVKPETLPKQSVFIIQRVITTDQNTSTVAKPRGRKRKVLVEETSSNNQKILKKDQNQSINILPNHEPDDVQEAPVVDQEAHGDVQAATGDVQGEPVVDQEAPGDVQGEPGDVQGERVRPAMIKHTYYESPPRVKLYFAEYHEQMLQKLSANWVQQ